MPQDALHKSCAMAAVVREILAAVSVADSDRARAFSAVDLTMELPFARSPFPRQRHGADAIGLSAQTVRKPSQPWKARRLAGPPRTSRAIERAR